MIYKDIANSYNDCLTSDLTMKINLKAAFYDINVEYFLGDLSNLAINNFKYYLMRFNGCILINKITLDEAFIWINDMNYTKSINEVFYHELGHLFDLVLYKKHYSEIPVINDISYFSHFDNAFLSLFENELSNLSKKYGTNNGDNYYCKYPQEGFAQLFCEYVLGTCSSETCSYFNKLFLDEGLIEKSYLRSNIPEFAQNLI